MYKISLFGKTLNELLEICKENSFPDYEASQIAEWLYKKGAFTIDEMTDISVEHRNQLKEKYQVGRISPARVQISIDGTKKYLFPLESGKFVETTYMPEPEKNTLGISVQVGCKMGCIFCMTGQQCYVSNLTSGEIINQFQSLPEYDKISNIAFNGMGEAFDNLNEVVKSIEILTSEYGYALNEKRITIFTIGIVSGLKEVLEKYKCHLSLSLVSPFEDERIKFMPGASPIKEIISIIKSLDHGIQRRIIFEYPLLKGINDTMRHIDEIEQLLNEIPCRINLTQFHPIAGSVMLGSDYQAMREFQEGLINKGVIATIKESQGEDISAACGMLSTKELMNN